MKRVFLALMAVALTTVSCTKTEEKIVNVEKVVDATKPSGTFTVSKKGTLTAQNGTPTKGMVEIGKDATGATFLHLGSDFVTQLATGTATIYLSKTATFTASPSTGNPDLKLIGIVTENGEAYYKLNTAAPAGLDYVIVWCGSASIPFGNGMLK